jgi:hypothetical protein
MRKVTSTVYHFDELPTERAKEKARDWFRECEQNNFDPEFEWYETAAKLLGITFADKTFQTVGGKTGYESDIRYSGFSSQGDGASFVGKYEFAPGCAEAIREEFPKGTVLHTIADDLTVLFVARKLQGKSGITARVTQNDHHYVHANTMRLDDVVAGENEDEEISADEEETILEAMRDFANWIYAGIEADWNWMLEDEQVDEGMRANEYEFDEDGHRA